VPSSSRPMSRLYPATSAARIVVSLRCKAAILIDVAEAQYLIGAPSDRSWLLALFSTQTSALLSDLYCAIFAAWPSRVSQTLAERCRIMPLHRCVKLL
jgi:hypothetical protein